MAQARLGGAAELKRYIELGPVGPDRGVCGSAWWRAQLGKAKLDSETFSERVKELNDKSAGR